MCTVILWVTVQKKTVRYCQHCLSLVWPFNTDGTSYLRKSIIFVIIILFFWNEPNVNHVWSIFLRFRAKQPKKIVKWHEKMRKAVWKIQRSQRNMELVFRVGKRELASSQDDCMILNDDLSRFPLQNVSAVANSIFISLIAEWLAKWPYQTSLRY